MAEVAVDLEIIGAKARRLELGDDVGRDAGGSWLESKWPAQTS